MPPDNHLIGTPEGWLRFARSDLSLAQAPKPADVLFETLCFHTQQAAEKALKAVLIAHNVEFPRTHNLRTLLDLIPAEIDIPDAVEDAMILTEYAVSSRYPGFVEPIGAQEYQEAVNHAEVILTWAEAILQN